MRTRQRDTRDTVVLTNSHTHGPAVSYFNESIHPSSGGWSCRSGYWDYMEDTVNEFDTDNPCYHYCEEHQTYPAQNFSVDRVVAPTGNCISGTLAGCGNMAASWTLMDNNAGRFTCTPDAPSNLRWSIPDYSAEAWRAVYPKIHAEMNALNSIYELKDLKRLPGLVEKTRKAFKQVRELANGWKWEKRHLKNREIRFIEQMYGMTRASKGWADLLDLPLLKCRALTLAEILDRALKIGAVGSEHFLNWKFAMEPLLNDTAALFQAAHSVDQQLDRLLKEADGTLVSSHWSKYLTVDDVSHEGEVDIPLEDANNVGTSSLDVRVTAQMLSDPKYTFTCRYGYTYPDMAYELKRKLAKRDAYGLHLSPANIWAATRWSFVIDWFLGIEDQLRGLTVNHLEPLVHIQGASHSITYKHETSVWIHPWRVYQETQNPAVNAYGGCGARKVASRTQSIYTRDSVIPLLVTVPKTSDFSKWRSCSP